MRLNGELQTPAPWSVVQTTEAKGRLKALQDAGESFVLPCGVLLLCSKSHLMSSEDDERKAKEAALNELEGYIYKVKNRILDDEDKLKAVSTDEQRQEVLDLASATEDWLYDEGRNQKVEVYRTKQADLRLGSLLALHLSASLNAVVI